MSVAEQQEDELAYTMPPSNRSGWRDIHIYDANDPTAVLGGLILSNGLTNVDLYSMVEILIKSTGPFSLRNEVGVEIKKDHHPLQSGKYYIVVTGSFIVNDEPWLVRTTSLHTGTRVQSFCDAIRSRDRRCVVSGTEAIGADFGDWLGFKVAHIFPLAYEHHWIDHNFNHWISLPPETGGIINSVQNGLLLKAEIHQLFNSYAFSINPDENYKIVCFSPGWTDIAGKHLDQRLLNDPQRPVDELLRWHFRQAVLANVRGAGEPIFEHDFPPGSDIVGDILRGPKSAERMEYELFGRLAAQVEICSSKVA